jgi:hypothetical protein
MVLEIIALTQNKIIENTMACLPLYEVKGFVTEEVIINAVPGNQRTN